MVLDPGHTLIPRLGMALSLQTPHPPAWINRNHPRGSLRLNLLAVPPSPAFPGPRRRRMHYILALTSALPLFDRFLARLGVASWSTSSGDVLVHDLALLAVLGHHRTRLGEGPPSPRRCPIASTSSLRPC